VTIVAKVRDEAGLQRTDLAERSVATGHITPLDSALPVAASDTGAPHPTELRPHIDNYRPPGAPPTRTAACRPSRSRCGAPRATSPTAPSS
jgi:hypothetical protein